MMESRKQKKNLRRGRKTSKRRPEVTAQVNMSSKKKDWIKIIAVLTLLFTVLTVTLQIISIYQSNYQFQVQQSLEVAKTRVDEARVNGDTKVYPIQASNGLWANGFVRSLGDKLVASDSVVVKITQRNPSWLYLYNTKSNS